MEDYLKELLGSELLHVQEFAEEGILTPPEKILPDFIIEQVKVELHKEIYDWRQLGFTPRFVFDDEMVGCELIPNHNPRIAVTKPIYGFAHLGKGYNEEVGCLVAILNAGFGDDYKEELQNRDLEHIL